MTRVGGAALSRRPRQRRSLGADVVATLGCIAAGAVLSWSLLWSLARGGTLGLAGLEVARQRFSLLRLSEWVVLLASALVVGASIDAARRRFRWAITDALATSWVLAAVAAGVYAAILPSPKSFGGGDTLILPGTAGGVETVWPLVGLGLIVLTLCIRFSQIGLSKSEGIRAKAACWAAIAGGLLIAGFLLFQGGRHRPPG